MEQTSRHDAWNAGDSYDQYMGRWSKQIAPRFLDWLQMPSDLDWLEVGCGTGALSAAIVAQCKPKSLLATDPSEGFLAKARSNVPGQRATFLAGDAQNLTVATESKDVVVSALALNFVPDKLKALTEMNRVARAAATIAFYVWDYPGRGVEFMGEFWKAAIALDPGAAELAEDKRFPFCSPDGLADLARAAGLAAPDCEAIEAPTVFSNFDDYWRPFTMGAGPAPGYCTSLGPSAQQRLKDALYEALPMKDDGSIHLKTRAWAIRTLRDS